jgi:hypothetical protein
MGGLDGVLDWLGELNELVREAAARPQWRAGKTLDEVSISIYIMLYIIIEVLCN